jgi:hypothetical protein
MANQLFDIYRNNVRTTAEMMRISLENAARLQEQQLGMVRNMLDQNSQSAERAAGAQSMEQLVALQSEIAGRQLQSLGDFWTSVWNTAAESQRSFFERVRSEGAEVASKTYDAAARITEDMSRSAANLASRAGNASQEGVHAASSAERKARRG